MAPARVSVGATFADPPLIALAVLTAAAGVAAALLPGPPASWAAAVAGLGLLGLGFRAWLVTRGRRWITATDDGFVLEDRSGTTTVPDTDVVAVAGDTRTRFVNGVPKGVRRTGAITVAGRAPVPFRYVYTRTAGDPLGPLFDRLLNHLVDQFKRQTAAGGTVDGPGWTLGPGALRVDPAGRREAAAIPIADVAAADVVGIWMSVWVAGQAAPATRLRAASPNALVLCQFLQDVVAARPAAGPLPPNWPGRLLFERDLSVTPAALVGGTAFAVVAVCVAVVLFWSSADELARIAGLGLALGSISALIRVWVFRVSRTRFYEYGVQVESTFRGNAHVLYRDVETFTYNGIRWYQGGIYSVSEIRLTFDPFPGRGGRVVYTSSFRNRDPASDRMLWVVSRAVAAPWLDRLRAGDAVPWTRRLRLTPNGIEYTLAGWFGPKSPDVVPYTDVGELNIDDGVFYLARRAGGPWAVTQPVSDPNFFPGLAVLFALLAREDEPNLRGINGRAGVAAKTEAPRSAGAS